jgi:acyl-lipid omega-6 desaturase (Delta-12 desaturase)
MKLATEAGAAGAGSPAAAARAWRGSLPPRHRRMSNLRGLTLVAVAYAVYLLLFAGMFLMPGWPGRLAATALCPIAIGMLFIIGHDAAHGTLTATGWLNRLLGRLVFLPPLHPFTSWCHAHNTMHHGWTNFKGREPAFPPFSKAEYDVLPWWRRRLERVYRSAGGIGLFYFLDFYVKHLLLPGKRHRPPYRVAFFLDRLLVAAFLACQVYVGYHLALYRIASPTVALAWAVIAPPASFLVWLWFMGFVSYIQHTHPGMAWYDKEEEWSFYHVQLTSTAHVTFPWVVERVFHNIMDHPAHHLDPTIPLTELPVSQKQLERSYPEHAVVVRWTPREFLRLTRCCKLYDYERHCWLDFEGNPTTPAGLAGLPRREKPEEVLAGGRPVTEPSHV